ncbi:MAG: hypothetical protein WDN04_07555 [Rhodospirillales bacterium]
MVDGGLLLRAAASLVAVLVMAVLAGRLVRARLRLPSPHPGALRLRATLALDTRRRLHLVDTEAGTVLILTGGATDCLLPWPTPGTTP